MASCLECSFLKKFLYEVFQVERIQCHLDITTGNLIKQPPFEIGRFFTGGYDLKINAGVGMKLSNHFTAMALGEYTFRDQPAVSAAFGNSTGDRLQIRPDGHHIQLTQCQILGKAP